MQSVWRQADTYDPPRAGPETTWIFTIARNRRIDAERRGPRRTFDGDDPSLAPGTPSAPDALFADAPTGKAGCEALIALPSDQMDVIRLSFFEDRPHAEIERMLAIPLGTVKSRLRLAMNRLRAHLGEYGPTARGKPPDGEQAASRAPTHHPSEKTLRSGLRRREVARRAGRWWSPHT